MAADDISGSPAHRHIGRPMNSVEGIDIVTGRQNFVDNINPPRVLHAAIQRSPLAHARIRHIDTSRAAALPGVLAVATGRDAEQWSRPLPSSPPNWTTRCLAVDKVIFSGEPVAAVAATSRYVAEDAAELIEVDYDPLPPVIDPLEAIQTGSPLIFEANASNVMMHDHFVWGEVDKAFGNAHRVFSDKFRWHRMGGQPIETNGCIAQWDVLDGLLTIWSNYQRQIVIADLAATLDLPLSNIRAHFQPKGGSFGTKHHTRLAVIAAILSRKARGRPVKYIEDRVEHLLSTSQSWDRRYEGAVAVDRAGRLTGLKIKLLDDMGATTEARPWMQAYKPISCFTSCYRISAAEYDVTCVATNKPPQAFYRGAGPPPHFWVIEHLIDVASRGLKVDPVEMRARNYLEHFESPYELVTGAHYDSGDYMAAQKAVCSAGDYENLRLAQAKARVEGRIVGVAVVSAIEVGASVGSGLYRRFMKAPTSVPYREGVSLRMDATGRMTVQIGFAPEGQGQRTFATYLLADYFGISANDIRVVTMDSLAAPPSHGPAGSRLAVALTGALLGAAELLKAKLIHVAAELLEAATEDIELVDGNVIVRGTPNRRVPVAQVAAAIATRPELLPPGSDPDVSATYVWAAPFWSDANNAQRDTDTYLTAANSCHLIQIEIDPTTGHVEILKYVIADDCGTRLNPSVLEGMIQGGVAQGVGAALLEEHVFTSDGQQLTSTLMDYLMPTIHDVPHTQKISVVTPSPIAPLGVKGGGESAIHATPAAILCAINDALEPFDVAITEVPATPDRLLTLIPARFRSTYPRPDRPL